MTSVVFHGGTVVLEDRLVSQATVEVRGKRIQAVHFDPSARIDGERVDIEGGYLVPGFVDLHVHGGDGADFMDGDGDSFRTICRAHARHGTSSLLPTTTV